MEYRYTDERGKHLHSFNGKPLIGCTQVTGVVNKVLTWWASGMALSEIGWKPLNRDEDGNELSDPTALANRKEECIRYARECYELVKQLSFDEYFALLQKCYRAHSVRLKKAGKKGTDAHELCEIWIKSVIAGREVTPDPQIEKFAMWCRKNVRRFLYSEVYMFSQKMWTGGISDFGYEDMNGNYGVADIKNRNKFYPTDLFQCGGYDEMLTENMAGFNASGERVFELDKPFKFHAGFPLVNFTEPTISFNVHENRETFKHLLAVYKAIQFLEEGKQ